MAFIASILGQQDGRHDMAIDYCYDVFSMLLMTLA
jgi:hypothetical protein